MICNKPVRDIDPEWTDVVMKILPKMYAAGDVTGGDDFVFVYVNAYLAVGEELKRGATAELIHEQTSRILQYIDETDRPPYEKEHFAALFARAVDDAIKGRPPCVLH
jgi:hypothetical protein